MVRRTSIVAAVAVGLAAVASAATAGGSDVQKLAKALFEEGAVEELTRVVTSEERAALRVLGVGLPRRGVAWYRVSGPQGVRGHIVRWQERGKHGMVELLVAAGPELAVAGVLVVKHRERWGAGITRKGFLKQFIGKSREDAWRIGGDVDAITSATISTRAVAHGTRNVLHFLAVLGVGGGDDG
jgi:Na+-translocating ferredoxin:NAD+ oxidoreductase RnfG subunit